VSLVISRRKSGEHRFQPRGNSISPYNEILFDE
jgi:hypothetical protein